VCALHAQSKSQADAVQTEIEKEQEELAVAAFKRQRSACRPDSLMQILGSIVRVWPTYVSVSDLAFQMTFSDSESRYF
jgi:hypothetical protein